MVACIHHQDLPEPPRNGEHPIIAIVAVVAMIAAMLLIMWARVEVHGTNDIEATFVEGTPLEPQPDAQREVDEAVTSGRFATGVSPQ
jgi:hypothetical protein